MLQQRNQIVWAITLLCSATAARGDDAARLFSDRILPILQSQQPSSCSACHFSGVSLRDYIRPTPAETFAGLRQAGLIDVERPDESKLLNFLSRSPEPPNPTLEQLRQTEHAAFRDWIRAAVRDPQLLSAPATEPVGVELPLEVVRHARRDRVLASFVDNVWTEMARCVNCHSPERNRGKIAKFGQEYVDSISWLVPHDPAGTLVKLEETGNIDLDDPAESQLLTKPAGLVKHGGGPKFQPGDVAYRKFLGFLTDYAAVRQGRYQTAVELPPPPAQLALLTAQHLRITHFPPDVGAVHWRVDLHGWDHDAGAWAGAPIGSTSGKVNVQQHQAQGMVHLLVSPDAPDLAVLRENPLLPRGPWLAKVYLDRADRRANNPVDDFGAADLAGTVEIRGDWPPGYQPPQIIRFPSSD